MRHIRGIVGLALFVILLLMFVIFAFSKAGQQSLARVNLAWSTDAYSQLGYQSYQAERYDRGGPVLRAALQRDPTTTASPPPRRWPTYEAGTPTRPPRC